MNLSYSAEKRYSLFQALRDSLKRILVARIELYSKRFEAFRILSPRACLSGVRIVHQPFPTVSPTTLMSHDGLSRAFLRAAAPRVSSKAAADIITVAANRSASHPREPRSFPFSPVIPASTMFHESVANVACFPIVKT